MKADRPKIASVKVKIIERTSSLKAFLNSGKFSAEIFENVLDLKRQSRFRLLRSY